MSCCVSSLGYLWAVYFLKKTQHEIFDTEQGGDGGPLEKIAALIFLCGLSILIVTERKGFSHQSGKGQDLVYLSKHNASYGPNKTAWRKWDCKGQVNLLFWRQGGGADGDQD